MKHYFNYIFEGGAATKSPPIPKPFIREAKTKVADLLKKLGVQRNEYEFVGSGKTLPGWKKHFGDIDVVIQKAANDTDKRESLFAMDKKLKSIGFETTLAPGFDQTSFQILLFRNQLLKN